MTYLDDMISSGGSIRLAAELRARLFDTADFDTILTFDPDHVAYLTGYRSMASDMGRHYALAAVANRRDVRLIVSASDGPPALEAMRDPAQVMRYGTFYVDEGAGGLLQRCRKSLSSFHEATLLAINELDGNSGTLGVDETGHAWRTLDIPAFFPGLCQITAGEKLRAARARKLPEEIEYISRAVKAAETGISAALRQARPGMTELEIATIVTNGITASGGIARAIAVTSGSRSALVDAFPTDRKLEDGDILRIDLGCTYRGYWADMARTGFIGRATPLQKQRFEAITTGLEAEREKVKAGASASEVFDAAVNAVRGNGISDYRRHHCGHGIGITINEFPQLSGDNHITLEPGMVLCIETPFYAEGWGGMMTEDIVVVTEGGHEPLTTLSRELTICGEG